MMDSQENALNQGTLDEQKPNQNASEIKATETKDKTTDAKVPEEKTAADEAQTETAAADDVKPQDEAQKTETPAAEDNGVKGDDLAHKVYKTKKEVLERTRQIAQEVDNPDKDEVDHLKTMFYKLHIAEREKEQKEYRDARSDREK